LTPEENISNGEPLIGLCVPNIGNPQHPNEREWDDFSCKTETYHETANETAIGLVAGVITGVLVIAKAATFWTS
jgi:hypothetical protein